MKPRKSIRCVIVTAPPWTTTHDGVAYETATPEQSFPHIGKHGTAEYLDNLIVKITLDDGNVIYGYECWWAEEQWEGEI